MTQDFLNWSVYFTDVKRFLFVICFEGLEVTPGHLGLHPLLHQVCIPIQRHIKNHKVEETPKW